MSCECGCIDIKVVFEDETINVPFEFGEPVEHVVAPDTYTGPVTVTPSESEQTLLTKDKLLTDNINVNPIPSEYVDAKADYDNALSAFGVESDLADGITALTEYSNEITGEQDETLSDAVYSLGQGYGQGRIEGVTEVVIETPASNVTELNAVFSSFVNSGETCFFVRKDAMTGTYDTILVPYISGEINPTILRRNKTTWSTLATTNSAYLINMNAGDKFIKVTLT